MTRCYTLEEVCTKITDGSHHSPKSVISGYPMASVKDMTPFGINLSSCRLISHNDFEKLVKQGCIPLKGDVLIAKDGNSCLETVCEVKEDLNIVLLSSIAILRPDTSKISSTYLKYILESPIIKKELKAGYVTGAAIPRVILQDFKRFKVLLPSVAVQRKVTSILFAYDELIENNTRRIKILEEIAQMLYREWFVKFRFPGHEKVKMVESELGLIPKGWQVKTLGEVCNITMGQSPKSEYYNPSGEGLPFHQGVSNFNNRYPEHEIYCTVDKRIASAGDILFSVRAPVGRINIADKKLIIGRGLAAIRHKNDLQSFLYYQLKAIFNEEDIIGNGSIFNSVTKQDLANVKVIVSNNSINKEFNEKVIPIDQLIRNLTQKNIILHCTRDLLLPKLTSGELDVEGLDITVGDD